MPDNSELRHLPNQSSTALMLSEARARLVARAREDAARLIARSCQEPYFAAVTFGWKWGFIDTEGKFIVEPAFYSSPGHFCDFDYGYRESSSAGAAFTYAPPVRKGNNSYLSLEGPFGFVDHRGNVSIKPAFESTRGFREGLAGVALNGKWGFIFKDGTFAIDPRFESAEHFQNGLCIVKLDSAFGVIDSSGEFVISPRFESLRDFAEGLACAKLDGKSGYINKQGEFAISPRFDSAERFQDGLARVKLNGKETLIDRDGNIIFQCDRVEDEIGRVIDGAARVTGKVAYFINSTGKQITDPAIMRAVGDFSEGLGEVRVPADEWGLSGYVDNSGQIKIKPIFDSSGNFESGRTWVYTTDKERKWIDKTGRFVDDPKFALAGRFCEGLARIRVGNLFGYVDDSLKIVIEPRFTGAGHFSNGRAQIWEGKKIGFIDKTGRIVIPRQFQSATNFR